jgi:hypothetical protein
MTIRITLSCFVLAFGAFLLEIADTARAADGPLDQIGGVCVPDGVTIREGLYETRGFGIGFRGSNTGTIRLLCSFTVSGNMIGTNIGITFLSVIDGDGIAEGARVQAVFRHAALGSNIAVTNGVCDSNTSTLSGPHNVACFFPSYTIRINESYWWDVEIQRSDPTINVEFLGVGMRYLN